jgi:CMP/dCMP kinase
MEELAQHKKYIITVAGGPGSGKSTASKIAAERLGYEHFSSGDLFRAIGRERGIDVYQTNLAAEQEEDIDHLVDQRLRDIGAYQDEVVIDSRLAWHWMPQSFKIFLDIDPETAASRILAKMDPFRLKHEHIPDDPKKYAVRLRERLEVEARRYKARYKVDIYDQSNYDLVINTGTNDSEAVVEIALEAYRKWLDNAELR